MNYQPLHRNKELGLLSPGIRKGIASMIFVFCVFSLRSQTYDFNYFRGLIAEGNVPDDFTTLSSVKTDRDMTHIGQTDSKSERTDQEHFILQSNYIIDDLLHSGKVIFGDPVTIYLNRVKDIILKDDPRLAEKIRIYAMRSTDVNAWTTNNGIVLVTTGLLARVSSEAQLAFILCHEFSHYTEKHAINSYIDVRRMERGFNMYHSVDLEDLYLTRFRYSKKVEMEADRLGLELFTKSGYSYDAVNQVFDLLSRSDYPVAETDFDNRFFDSGDYIIPQNYFLDTLHALHIDENYDDEKQTHPNIKKRREAVADVMPEDTAGHHAYFILPESEFSFVHKLCMFDLCESYLSESMFEDAIYEAYLAKQEEHNSAYLDAVTARALYGLSKYANARVYPRYKPKYTDVQGLSKQVYYFVDRIPANELNVLALKKTWDAYMKDAGNEYLLALSVDLARDLEVVHSIHAADFITMPNSGFVSPEKIPAVIIPDVTTPDSTVESDSAQNFFSDSKDLSEIIATDYVAPYWKYAFIDELGNTQFSSMLKKNKTQLIYEDNAERVTDLFEKSKFRLGIDNLVFVNPAYQKIDDRYNEAVLYEASEKARLDLKSKIEECAGLVDMQTSYLDHNLLHSENVESFNQLASLNLWLTEQFDHIQDQVRMINSKQEEFNNLASIYRTPYFAWFGTIHYIEPEKHAGIKLLPALIWPLAPIVITDVATPDYATYFYVVIGNAETGIVEFNYELMTTLDDTSSLQSAYIYYILQQIKSPYRPD